MDNASPRFRSHEDDEYYHHHHGDNNYYSSIPASQMYSYTPPPIDEPTSLSQRLWVVLDRLTGPNFAFVFTISVIIIVQARGPLERWYHNFIFKFRYMTVGEWITDLWWMGLDYLRAVWQMALELGRNSLRLLVPLNNTAASATSSNARRRRLRQTPSSRRSFAMPELEEVVPTDGGNDDNNNESSPTRESRDEQSSGAANENGRLRWSQRELEPAFLRDCDYPAGWMVYHPVLGVVTKTAADKYDAEREQQNRNTTTPGEKETISSVAVVAKKHSRTESSNGATGSSAPYYAATVSNGMSSSTSYVEDVVVGTRDAAPPPSSSIPQQQASGVPVLRSIAASG